MTTTEELDHGRTEAVADMYDAHFAALRERLLAAGADSRDLARRTQAFEVFANVGYPKPRDEEWQFTNIKAIRETQFATASSQASHLTRELFDRALVPGLGGIQVVFFNGRYAPEFSTLGALPKGVVIAPLGESLQAGKYKSPFANTEALDLSKHPFAALNEAFAEDGAYIHVAANTHVEAPIHVIHISASHGTPTVSYPRHVFFVEKGSEATVIETYVGGEGDVYLTNALTETHVAENAVLWHYKRQIESTSAFHVSHNISVQERNAKFQSLSIGFGAKIARNDLRMILAGQGADGHINGVYVLGGDQLHDNHSVIDHAVPHCDSREIYKGILDDGSRSVFNGRIIVRLDAQKTNAKQTSRSMVLSDRAIANANPQLEIYADDVKCTHGATIGQIDESHLFYLRARGISKDDARTLLIYAFVNDLLEEIRVDALREDCERRVWQRQKGAETQSPVGDSPRAS